MSTPLAHHWDGPSASKRDCHSDQTSSDSTDDEEDFRDLVPLRKFKEHQESLQTAQIESHTTHTVTLKQHEPGSVAKPLALKRATDQHLSTPPREKRPDLKSTPVRLHTNVNASAEVFSDNIFFGVVVSVSTSVH